MILQRDISTEMALRILVSFLTMDGLSLLHKYWNVLLLIQKLSIQSQAENVFRAIFSYQWLDLS